MARGRKPEPKPTPARVADSGKAPFAPPMPEGMGAAAAAKWTALVPMIARLVPLQDVDADALRQYCEAAVLRAKAVTEMDGAPLLLLGPNGAAYANPLMKIVKEQDSLLARLSERFGLDPSSRRRLHVEAAKKGNALTELLARGRNRPKPPLA
jgi:P27 family predicted phage terminase small subunit